MSALREYRLAREREISAAMAAHVTGRGYESARKHRMTRERDTSGGAGDDHLDQPTLWDMREINRDLFRNNGLYRGLIKLVVRNVLGPCGFRLKAKNDNVDAFWKDWCQHDADRRGRQSFWPLFKAGFRAELKDGDFFWNLDTYGRRGRGSLMPCEGDRVLSPTNAPDTITNGIRFDRWGVPLSYFVADQVPSRTGKLGYLSGIVNEDGGRWIPAEQMIHQVDPERVSHTRGEPLGCTVPRELDDLDALLVSTRVANRVAAMQSFFITKQEDPEGYAEGMADEDESDGDGYPPVESMEPGELNYLNVGEKAESVGSAHPGNNFDGFIRLLCRLIGVVFGVPLELVLLDFTQGNFAAARLAINQSQDTFREMQRHVLEVVERIFAWVMDLAIARGVFGPDVVAGSAEAIALVQHSWILPGWPYMEPVKDIKADVAAVQLGTNSRQRIAGRRGDDWWEILDELADESAAMKAKGVGGQVDEEKLNEPTSDGTNGEDGGDE